MVEGKVHKIEEYFPGKIVERTVEKEMQSSYLDYAMSVIVGRALPDVRDGLKPVHRRILFGMHELGNTHDKPYKKSARIVGEILGKYHPHGDAAIYDSIVRMVRDFSLRYPLIGGQGNFGSVDGDEAAAMRYTEIRMNRLSEEMLEDIDKETVDFAPNFDGTLKEPTVLPCKIPNLLINGSSGIAVGMATNIPPHNLNEVVDGTIALIDKPDLTPNELLGIVKGPDFPTAGLIVGRRGIVEAYLKGKGIIKVRARAVVEESKGGRKMIVVSELPYQVNKAQLIGKIADLVKQKRITGISDINDRSDREGMRMEIELKRDANEDIVLKQLYTHTPMETVFGAINLALVDNQPKVMPLRDMITQFIFHRKEIVTKRSAFELGQAKKRAHILEGLGIAIEKIDGVTKVIREAKDGAGAMTRLMELYSLTDEQAKAILEMKLRRLTTLERGKVENEHSELLKKIEWLKGVLGDEKQVYSIIKEELLEVKKLYGNERRTEIIEEEEELEIEDLIPREKVAILITQGGYIKRIPLREYKTQRRGGKGVIGTDIREEDVVRDVITASTHDYILFFTDRGIVHWLKAYRIPSSGRYSMGKAIVNLLELKDEKVSAWIPVSEFREDESLVMATKKGIVKRTSMAKYSRPRRGGIIALTIREDDALIDVKKTDGKRCIILGTKEGYSIRFSEKDAREIGRAGQGVRGIRLREEDEVVSMTLDDKPTVLTITENGYGKRTDIREYRIQVRGGKGVINIQTSGRNGHVVGVGCVSDEDELLLISSAGKVIRVPVRGISVIGRNTQGVRIMRLGEGEKVVALGRVLKEEEVVEEKEAVEEGVKEEGESGGEAGGEGTKEGEEMEMKGEERGGGEKGGEETEEAREGGKGGEEAGKEGVREERKMTEERKEEERGEGGEVREEKEAGKEKTPAAS